MKRLAIACLAGFFFVWLTAGCGAPAAEPGTGDATLAQAAAEATAIVGRAQATALVLQAQAAATALVAQAGAAPAGPAPTAVQVASVSRPTAPALGAGPTPAPTTEMTPSSTIEVIRVGFGGDGGFIHVQFSAPPDIAEHWWQGSVYVVDEATGIVYNEIPVMPKIGPLIARPRQAGQLGYVLLVNAPPGLRPGAMVTVVLGNFRQEHVLVQ